MTDRKRRFHSRTNAIEALEGISLDGKTIAITGTTSGIGVETARSLVLKGAHLVMLNRNIQESEKQKRTFIEEKPNARIDIIQCDLNSLASVRKAGEAYLEKGWPLHGLILNAGIMGPSNKMTSDGFEAHFGVNHVAHFMLLESLLPVLRSSAPSRLVILSSKLSRNTGISPNSTLDKKLETLCPETPSKSFFRLYAYSKMCNMLVAFKVHRDEYSNGISTYSVHPGSGVRTSLNRDFPFQGFKNFLLTPFTKNASQGAATSVYCVAHPEAPSGKYWESCWDDEKSLDKKVARDEELQDALWKRTKELIAEWKKDL
uniref:SDR family NAD(P)-dependent oxidoreductase n=1 Tax=Caenorhabditis tropicalis TaxID=1561998 RepID=A0A1I7TD49_9PELO